MDSETSVANNSLSGAPAPAITANYKQALLKASREPESLTREEVRLLVHGLPRKYRHKNVSPEYIEAAFDNGQLTLHELARTNIIDVNRAIEALGRAGHLQKASRLVEHMIKFEKANQHTLASFFQACRATHNSQVAIEVWERWAEVRPLLVLHTTQAAKSHLQPTQHLSIYVLLKSRTALHTNIHSHVMEAPCMLSEGLSGTML
jgi:hypothetical protein